MGSAMARRGCHHAARKNQTRVVGRSRRTWLALLLLGCLLPCRKASAGEETFAWTYTTDLVPKGKMELEHKMTTRLGKEHGTYRAWDFREELEYGVTDRFQAALYFNHHYAKASNSVPSEDPNNPGRRLAETYETGGEDVHPGHDPAVPFSSYHFDSVSGEFIYRLLSPYKDPIGVALYMEPSVGSRDAELEWKLILHKTWLEDQWTWAFNANYALEFEREANDEWERDAAFEWLTGLAYRFMPRWSAGVEFWNHHEFAKATVHEHSAYFLGPTLHYGAKNWWVTVGFLHQLPLGQAFTADQKEFAKHDGYIFGEEHEKYYYRFKVGFDF